MMAKTTRVLLMEDNPGDARLILEMIAEAGGDGFELEWVSQLSEGLERLSAGKVDLVLLDLGLPDSRGIDTFSRAYAHAPEVPFVLMTGLEDETLALTSIRQGAQDYLVKGETNAKLLLRAIRYATERKKAEIALEVERKKLDSLLNSLPAFVHLKAPDHLIRFANRRFIEIFGEPGDKPCYQVLRGRSEPCEDCRASEVLETKVPQKFEWTSPHNNHTYEIYHYPFCADDGLLVLTLGVDITERKLAEQKLRESEQDQRESEARFRAIFDQAAVGVAQIESDTGRFIQANKKYCDIVGLTPEAMMATNFMAITHPDDLQADLSNMQKLKSGLVRDFSMEKRYFRPDGSMVWVNLTVSPMWKIGEQPNYHIAVVEDITKRKRAEKALQRQQEEQQVILDSVPAMIFYKDTDNRFVRVNKAVTEATGFSAAEIEGKTAFEIYPDQAEEYWKDDLEVMTAGNPKTNILESMETAKGMQWLQTDKIPYRDEKGHIIGIIGFSVDITERKAAEKALQEHLKFLQTLIDAIPNPIFYKDVKGVYLGCNKALCDFLGLPKEEIIGKSVFEIYPKDQADKYHEMDADLFRQQRVQRYDFSMGHADGTRHIVNINKATYSTIDGTLAGIVGVMVDITDREQAEEKLRESEQNLRYLASQLLTAQEQEKQKISLELHDTVAQELATLKIDLENLQPYLPEKPVEEFSSRISQLLQKLQRTLSSIRTLAYDLRPPDLKHFGLVQAIKTHCEEFTARTGIKVDLMAAGIEASHLDQDAAINLYRIIQEGLTNVWRHTQAMNVNIRLVASFPKIILRLEDDGQGFDVMKQEASRHGDKHLGLLGMRERVTLLGGEMKIESQLKKGTKISIEIPWKGEDLGTKEEAPHC